MATLTFSSQIQKKDIKRDGTCFVRIRATLHGKSKYIITNICIATKQMTKDLRIKDRAIANQVDELVYELRKKSAELIGAEELSTMTIEEAMKRVLGDEAKNFHLDFPDYADKVIAQLGAGGKNYRSAVNALKLFIGQEHFDISVLSSAKLFQFEQYLEAKHGKGARCVSLYSRSIAFIHTRARQEYNSEEQGEIKIANPYTRYKCPNQPPAKHRNIQPDIIKEMIKVRCSLSGRERLGVDVFLLSFCLMGMNAPDIFECGKEKNNIITYNRRKTRGRRADDAQMQVRIEPCVRELIEEYRGSADREFSFSERYSTYADFSRAVNIGLHEFEKRVELSQPLTLYAARHTWATVAGSRVCRIDKYTINDCLCHADPDMRVTDIYIEKDWEVLWDANAKVLSLFEWK